MKTGWRHSLLPLLLLAALLLAACQPGTSGGQATPVGGTTAATATAAPATAAPQGATPATGATAAPAGEIDPDSYQGVPAGITEEGYAYLGDPNAAITMEEFTDYLCPFCQRHVAETEPLLIEQYIRSGQLRLVFRDFPIASNHPTAHFGHEATVCAAEQSAGLFWAMHERVFAEGGVWGAADAASYMRDLAQELGADMAAYDACIASERPAAILEATREDVNRYGYSVTPIFRITRQGSEEAWTVRGAQPLTAFSNVIDALLAGNTPVPEPTPDPEAIFPPWMRSASMAPDPDRPGYTLNGDAFKGNPEAPVTVIEFCDLMDAGCREFALKVQSGLDEAFVEPGVVYWVFKHLPQRANAGSTLAAAAAECAGAQNKFWEMQVALLEGNERWAVADPVPELQAIAGEVGLDAEAFATCLDGRWAMEQIVYDQADAIQLGAGLPVLAVIAGSDVKGYPMTATLDELTSVLAEAANSVE